MLPLNKVPARQVDGAEVGDDRAADARGPTKVSVAPVAAPIVLAGIAERARAGELQFNNRTRGENACHTEG